MPRSKDKRSGFFKRKIRDAFATKPKTPAVCPALISPPIPISPRKKRSFGRVSVDESIPSGAMGSRSVRQRIDSHPSVFTNGSQDDSNTMKASPSKKTCVAPMKGILIQSNRGHSRERDANGRDSRGRKTVTFDLPVLERKSPSSFPKRIRPARRVPARAPRFSYAIDDDLCDGEINLWFPDATVPDSSTHFSPPHTEMLGKTNKRFFIPSESDFSDDDDEEGIPAAKSFNPGPDCRGQPKNLFTQPSSLRGSRALTRTNSFMAAPCNKELDEDGFDWENLLDDISDEFIVTMQVNGTDLKHHDEVIGVRDMSASQMVSSAQGTTSLADRLKVTVVPCQKDRASWDLMKDDMEIWPALLCITDKEFRADAYTD